ncbi:unnamed protein product [Leptidea sinapis]|uniref:Uncharacterized protein n=1 Tax=Leptidea sinapis TaxID=189913 RepID=A0A5E4Q2Y4_9NEOP|nr:unnamed protein product [Leptidea sinapis]
MFVFRFSIIEEFNKLYGVKLNSGWLQKLIRNLCALIRDGIPMHFITSYPIVCPYEPSIPDEPKKPTTDKTTAMPKKRKTTTTEPPDIYSSEESEETSEEHVTYEEDY